MANILTKIFGTKHDRTMKRLQPMVEQVNSLEKKTQKLSKEDMQSRMAELRQQVDKGASLDDMLFEVFAMVREAGWRQLQMAVGVAGTQLAQHHDEAVAAKGVDLVEEQDERAWTGACP
jgi:preprotein translocase subunit SecA